MDGERVRQRVELVIAGWPWQVTDRSTAAAGYIVEYEDGRWEFHLTGHGVVRGDQVSGERQIATLILRALSLHS